MQITVIGGGYVGIANAITLAKNHKIIINEVNDVKVKKINKGIMPIKDSLGQKLFKKYRNNIIAKQNLKDCTKNSELILISLPTNLINNQKKFDTSDIENTLKILELVNYKKPIIIRSTLPVGFMEKNIHQFPKLKIAYFPEFLREGTAIFDNLNPSRIIFGGNKTASKAFLMEYTKSVATKKYKIFSVSPTEAESIKLFSNSFLALRISFFNELDSFCLDKSISTKNVIQGLAMDPRIGNDYNNPSFGFGGYCLPKDSKQLESNFDSIPNVIIKSINKSNRLRINFIAQQIAKNKKIIGIYKIGMKKGSDNFKESSTIELIKLLKKKNVKMLIFEPMLDRNQFLGIDVIEDFKEFESKVDLIVANRCDKYCKTSNKKVFTRDIFNKN